MSKGLHWVYIGSSLPALVERTFLALYWLESPNNVTWLGWVCRQWSHSRPQSAGAPGRSRSRAECVGREVLAAYQFTVTTNVYSFVGLWPLFSERSTSEWMTLSKWSRPAVESAGTTTCMNLTSTHSVPRHNLTNTEVPGEVGGSTTTHNIPFLRLVGV